tara:strand:- start:6308 stop:8650 length:2343 start_codon:yes stop_codon:yes gene_type:complete
MVKEVLAQHKADRERRVSQANTYGQERVQDAKDHRDNLFRSLSNFSQTLQTKLLADEQKRIKWAQEEGVANRREKEIDDLDETGDDGIPQKEKEEGEQGEKDLKKVKKAFDTAFVNIQNRGGRYEDAYKVKSLSAWRLYAERKETAAIAGRNYSSWLAGEMQENDTLTLRDPNGDTFTPAKAETLEQKRMAMKALRRQFMQENGLLGIDRRILSDHFYNPAINAHRQLTAAYEKQDALEKSIESADNAFRHFDTSFKAKEVDSVQNLFNSLEGLQPEGKFLDRTGAWDYLFKGIESKAEVGEFTPDDLEFFGNQEIEKDGKKVKIKELWKGSANDRFLKLTQEVLAHQTKNSEAAIKAEIVKGKQQEQEIIDQQLGHQELIQAYMTALKNPQYGGYDFTRLKKLITATAPGAEALLLQESDIKDKISRNELTSEELSNYDPRLQDQYKAEAAIIDKQKGVTTENLKALEEFIKEDAKNVFQNRNHWSIRNIIPKVKADYLAALKEARDNPESLPKGMDAPSYAFQLTTQKYGDLSKYRDFKGYTQNLGLADPTTLKNSAIAIDQAEDNKNSILKGLTLGQALQPEVVQQLISKDSLVTNIDKMQNNPSYQFPPIVKSLVRRYEREFNNNPLNRAKNKKLDEIDVLNAIFRTYFPDEKPLLKPNSLECVNRFASANTGRALRNNPTSDQCIRGFAEISKNGGDTQELIINPDFYNESEKNTSIPWFEIAALDEIGAKYSDQLLSGVIDPEDIEDMMKDFWKISYAYSGDSYYLNKTVRTKY